jgi:hypothetical protein
VVVVMLADFCLLLQNLYTKTPVEVRPRLR